MAHVDQPQWSIALSRAAIRRGQHRILPANGGIVERENVRAAEGEKVGNTSCHGRVNRVGAPVSIHLATVPKIFVHCHGLHFWDVDRGEAC
ncbi:hypothetical protein LBMAG15_06130 [Actinomycetes bacterium]|nr:hypothetical protein LBMAG15_06130 [Actinomycetes bacterium]